MTRMVSLYTIFTIGHSNHSLEKLGVLLKDQKVACLVDVRSAPYSRFHPQFNKETIERDLPKLGIRYVFGGKQLGGRPEDPTCYKSRQASGEGTDFLHEVDYSEVMKRKWFQDGIRRLLELAEDGNIAVLCSEEDPAQCHRHHLISKYLLDQHPEVEVRHMRGDGTMYGAASVRASVNNPPEEQLSLF